MSFLGTLLDTSQRFDLPNDEKRDVQGELLKTFLAGVNRRDLVDGGAIHMLDDYLRNDDRALAAKAVILAPQVFRRDYPSATHPDGRPGHHAVLKVNEFGLIGSVNGERFAEKPFAQGGFDFLYQLSQSIELVQAIIYTRIRRAQRFMRLYRPNDADPLGYRYLRRDGERLTKDDHREVLRIDRILQNSGDEENASIRFFKRQRQNLIGFMTQTLASSLSADACPFETERANNGSLRGWYALDYRTIRLAFEDGYDGDDQIVAVQIHPEARTPFLGFRADEIVYPIRNPRADILYQGYGQSELEGVVRNLTAYLNCFALNAAQQSNNTIPRGILTLFGDYDARQLNFFRNEWNCTSGDTRVWTTEGAMTLKELARRSFGSQPGLEDGFNVAPAAVDVWDGEAMVPAHVACVGEKRAVRVRLADGGAHLMSAQHRLLIVDEHGELAWREAGDLRPGDMVASADTGVWPGGRTFTFHYDRADEEARLGRPHWRRFGVGPDRCDWTLDERGWELLGWIAGDGCINRNYVELLYHHQREPWIRLRHAEILEEAGIPYRLLNTREGGRRPVIRIYFEPLRRWLIDVLGFTPPGCPASKRLPRAVFALTPELRRAFLRGLFSADGGMRCMKCVLTSTRAAFREDAQLLLRSVGVPSTIYGDSVVVRDAARFEEDIGFLQPHKVPPHDRHPGHVGRAQLSPPALTARLAAALWDASLTQWTARQRGRANLWLLHSGRRGASLPRLRALADALAVQDAALRWNFVAIESVVDTGECITMYDLSMHGPRAQFVGNGVVMHNSFMSGAINHFKLPVMVARNKTEGGAQYTPVDTNATEMMMKSWILLQASFVCAFFGIDPSEINLESFTSRTSSLSGQNTQEKQQSSHDGGFTPLMRNVETFLNESIVSALNPKFAITLVGLYPEDEKAKHERQTLTLSVNEVREIDDEAPFPDPDVGNAPLNPNLMPLYLQKVQHRMRNDAIANGEDPAIYGGPVPVDPSDSRPSSGSPSAGPRERAGRGGDGTSARPSRSDRETRKSHDAEPPRLVVEIRHLTPAEFEEVYE